MVHYHGAPMGGPVSERGRFYAGRNVLVSFAYPEDLPLVAECASTFVLDCGAFTAWKAGGAVDVAAYRGWVEAWHRHPAFRWAIIPDVIDGAEEDNDGLIAEFCDSCNIRPHMLVPVWHLHESVGRLRSLCGTFTTVALGSSGAYATPGTSSWWARMNEAMAAVCLEGKPICQLHGLRMLNPAIFTRLPFASADSTNAVQNAGSLSRFGQYTPPSVWQRAAVIAARIESHQSPAAWAPADVTEEAFYAAG